MADKKPLGVILASTYLLFYGVVTSIFMVIIITALLTEGSQFSGNILSNINKDAMHDTFWAGPLHEVPICLVYLFLGICGIASGVGILMRQDWARKLFMIIASYDILENVLNIIFLKHALLKSLPWIIFDCIILFYFTRPKIKYRFE